MRIFTLLYCLFMLSTLPLISQIDFYGRRLTGQSPNSVSRYLLLEVSNGTSQVNNAANLNEFDHVSRQLHLFNLGIGYAIQVLEIDSLEEIQINLDTIIGGKIKKNAFRFHIGMQYEVWDRETRTMAKLGSSRFGAEGLSIAVSHEMSWIPAHRAIQLIPATAREQSLFASFYTGFEAGFDTGFGLSIEESGVLQITTDHLVRDVAEGDLTFDQYKAIERQLHESLRYQAPKNIGGSEWYFLATLKAQLHIRPLKDIPVLLSLGGEAGFDLARLQKRNQNRFGLFFSLGYLLY